ncbi:gustatory receptor [Homalodisca vitripennis]|nr:gustatory receptor [Homalodisca vitripennis]
MVGAFIVIAALMPIISTLLWANVFLKIKLIQNHLFLAFLQACMVSMFWAQGVFLVHFSYITQSITSSFTRITFKMERVVIRNHFRSLLPYLILNPDSDSEESTEDRLRIGLAGQLQGALSIKWHPHSPQSACLPQRDQSSTDGLQSLMNDYCSLCDTVREANTFYSDQLLVIVVSTFLHTTTDLSFFFLSFINKNIIGATDAGFTFLACTFFIVMLAHLCTNVTESADEMTRSVCRLLNMGVRDELQEQLEVFLLQLCNHKVELSACGLFNLNYGTLTSVCCPPSFVDV